MPDEETMSKISAKKIIEEVQTSDDRGPTSMYISVALFKRFKRACGPASPSRVIEKLMEHFIADVESEK